MPLVALVGSERVFARVSFDRTLPYYCPHCKIAMILKRGEIKIPHFAHEADYVCPYHKPESEMHFKMKEWVCTQLPGAQLEVRVDDTIFDVKSNDCVFECQASQISVTEQKQRESCAEKHHLSLFWIWAVPPFGKTFHSRGTEYTRVKATELEAQKDILLYYLEWHPITHKMVSFKRELTKPKISEWNEEATECTTTWEFTETASLDLKGLVQQ